MPEREISEKFLTSTLSPQEARQEKIHSKSVSNIEQGVLHSQQAAYSLKNPVENLVYTEKSISRSAILPLPEGRGLTHISVI